MENVKFLESSTHRAHLPLTGHPSLCLLALLFSLESFKIKPINCYFGVHLLKKKGEAGGVAQRFPLREPELCY